mmetsp:Transcript_8996/g.23459  ORF Transcript_8996/g.23459 Transcript_8996/m.23459 type:complete len:224 (-) Transcript_8996:245-916(-)
MLCSQSSSSSCWTRWTSARFCSSRWRSSSLAWSARRLSSRSNSSRRAFFRICSSRCLRLSARFRKPLGDGGASSFSPSAEGARPTDGCLRQLSGRCEGCSTGASGAGLWEPPLEGKSSESSDNDLGIGGIGGGCACLSLLFGLSCISCFSGLSGLSNFSCFSGLSNFSGLSTFSGRAWARWLSSVGPCKPSWGAASRRVMRRGAPFNSSNSFLYSASISFLRW